MTGSVKLTGGMTCKEAFADTQGMRPEADLTKQEEHFDYVRINFSMQCMDEFYETYPSITEGAPMYIAPEDRILIW